MEGQLHSLNVQRRAPDWPAAAVSGFAAGAVLMVLDLVWSTFVAGGGPWQTSHMIAPIVTGGDALPANFDFSVGTVAIALAAHYVLGIVFGLVLAAIMAALHLDTADARAIVAGAVFGALLYLVNFHVMAGWFPWLAGLRGWPAAGAHLVFGIVAAVLYRRLALRRALASSR